MAGAAADATALRVAIDGPPCADPGSFGANLVEPLRVRGHPAEQVHAELFWRDASVRLEHGREDVDAYANWLDSDALHREVLAPVAEHGEYLPSLRDPLTDRSTREPPRRLAAHGVLLVTGGLLLGRGLPFDRTIHLAMSSAARARHTPADQRWTLPAFDRYDAVIAPVRIADVVVRLEDPRRPAVRGLPV